MVNGKLFVALFLGFAVALPLASAADAPQAQKNTSELRLKGMKEAVADLEKGALKQKDFNDRPDAPYWPAFIELTKQECGVTWEPVVREKVSSEYVGGYNDVMMAEIEHRYGRGIFETLLTKAQEQK